MRAGDVLLDALPIAHNLPLACPGLQGFLLTGATVYLSRSTRGPDVFAVIDPAPCPPTFHVVPALLIQWINHPAAVSDFDLGSVRVVQSGGQRLQPETRVRAERVFRSVTVQENFGMAEGLLMFVRLDDPPEVRRLETVGRPICPDDEVQAGRRGRRRRTRTARSGNYGRAGRIRCGAITTRPSTTSARSPRSAFTARAT